MDEQVEQRPQSHGPSNGSLPKMFEVGVAVECWRMRRNFSSTGSGNTKQSVSSEYCREDTFASTVSENDVKEKVLKYKKQKALLCEGKFDNFGFFENLP